jgi:hypothetical protein
MWRAQVKFLAIAVFEQHFYGTPFRLLAISSTYEHAGMHVISVVR